MGNLAVFLSKTPAGTRRGPRNPFLLGYWGNFPVGKER
jgi:hypothetical protein